MHKTLEKLIRGEHSEILYYCPSCGDRLEYIYLEEELYHVRCKSCDRIEVLTYAKNPYEACMRAGGLENKPYSLNEIDGKILCNNCASDLMGCFDDPEIKVIQCPECGARISDVVEVKR